MSDIQRSNVYCAFYAVHAKNRDSDSYAAHFHENIEIYVMISGGKACLIDNKIYEINPGDVLVFKPNQIHKIIRNDESLFERYIISFNPYFLKRIMEKEEFHIFNQILNSNDIIISHLTDEEQKKFAELYTDYSIAHSVEIDHSKFHHTTQKFLFIKLVTHIFIALQEHGTSGRINIHQNQIITQILDYIDENFSVVTLDMLTTHFNLNKSYLCILFKKHTSMTINNYILNNKIAHAKKFLDNGKNATETAELCGFNDSSDFSRVFKKYTNLSPKKYQMKSKN